METLKGIEVKGHIGTWYEIDRVTEDGITLILMEHEEYGGDAAHIVVNEQLQLVGEDEYNWFDDYRYTLESTDKKWGDSTIDRVLK